MSDMATLRQRSQRHLREALRFAIPDLLRPMLAQTFIGFCEHFQQRRWDW
jgi:hypothetical protein